MPYLNQGIRESLDQGRKATKPGELNYLVSKLVNDYFAMRGLSYTSLNEVMGALECSKLEIYRRIGAPYENRKAIANGEIFVFQKMEA